MPSMVDKPTNKIIRRKEVINMMNVHGSYFYGNKISDYGLEHGRVDYRTLAKAFDGVLNNEIMQKTWEIGYWEQESGFVNNSEEVEELEERLEELEAHLYECDETEDGRNEYNIVAEEIAEIEEQIEELKEEADMDEIFQYFIVDDNGARILKEINEIVFYNEELDMYVWGVTHYGTSWDYVLTDIKCNVPYED